MPLYVKNKNRKTAYSLISALTVGVLVLGWFNLRPSFAQSTVDPIQQISLSASLFNAENRIITNGTYTVRFGIYTIDRTVADAYPSNTDAGTRIWEETQEVTVKGGMFRTFLGSVNPFPANLNFETGSYYVGIRIAEDSEMVPRKKLGSVPRAMNSQFLRGRTIGTNAGDIALLGKGGKIDIKNLPTGKGAKQLVLGNDSRFGDLHQQNTDIGTDSEVFNIGSGSALSGTNFDLTVSSSTTPPALRYNGSTGTWQFSNDGTTFSNVSDGTVGSVTLGVDTIGDYVASITAGNGLSGTASGEGSTPTFALDLLSAVDGTGATSSFSGLEFAGAGGDQLALLQGCANGQGLAWDDTAEEWICNSFAAGLSGTGTPGYVSYWSGPASLGSEQYLDEVRGGTGLDGSTAPNGSLLIGNGSGYSLATLTAGSSALSITNGVGTITLDIDVDTAGTTATSFANSGLEKTAQGVRLIGGCSDQQVLAWSSSNSRWECSNKTGGTSDWTDDGTTTYLTDVTSDFAVGGSSVAGSILSVDVSTGAVYFASGNTVDPTLVFEATDGDTATLGFNTNDSLYVTGGNFGLGDTSPLSLLTVGAGDAFQVNASGAVVAGTWQGTGIGVAYGGTGVATFGGTNTLLYTTSANTLSSIATANNGVLVTNGSGAPSIATDLPTAVTIGGAYIYRVGGTNVSLGNGGTGASLVDPNADRIFFWDDSASSSAFLGLASNLAITGTTLDLSPNVQLGSDGTDGTFTLFSEQGATDYTTTFQPGTQTQNITYTLPVDDGGASQVLVTDGTGNLSWSSVSGIGGMNSFTVVGDSGTQTINDGNTVTFVGGTNLTSVVSATDTVTFNLDSTLSGVTWNGNTIGVAYGGTGQTTFTSNGVLFGNGASGINVTTAGANASVLMSVSGTPTFIGLSGDVTIDNTGVVTIGADKVALGTDTTGNYVQSVTTSTVTGLTGGAAGSGKTRDWAGSVSPCEIGVMTNGEAPPGAVLSFLGGMSDANPRPSPYCCEAILYKNV